MTTIAWDGKSVAADCLATINQYPTDRNFKKLRQSKGKVYGCSGYAPLLEPLIEWHQLGADPATIPSSSDDDYRAGLIVFDGARCFYYLSVIPYPDELKPPYSWGVGSDFAIGAMKMGADARRAIEIAIECNVHTGGEIQVINLTPFQGS